MQRHSTGHDHLEVWAGSEKICHLHGGTDHLLKVVQQQQEVLLVQECFQQVEQWLSCDFFDVERLGDGRHDQRGIADGSQVHEIHAIGEPVTQFCCHLQAQAGFAGAAGTGQGEQAHVLTLQEAATVQLLPSHVR